MRPQQGRIRGTTPIKEVDSCQRTVAVAKPSRSSAAKMDIKNAP